MLETCRAFRFPPHRHQHKLRTLACEGYTPGFTGAAQPTMKAAIDCKIVARLSLFVGSQYRTRNQNARVTSHFPARHPFGAPRQLSRVPLLFHPPCFHRVPLQPASAQIRPGKRYRSRTSLLPPPPARTTHPRALVRPSSDDPSGCVSCLVLPPSPAAQSGRDLSFRCEGSVLRVRCGRFAVLRVCQASSAHGLRR